MPASVATLDWILLKSWLILVMYQKLIKKGINLPTEHTKNKVKHEEWSDDYQWHKVKPVEITSKSIICLFKYKYKPK